MSQNRRQITAHRRKGPRLDLVKETLKDNVILTYLEAREKSFINAENECEEGGNFTHFRSKSTGSSNSSLYSVLGCVISQSSLEGSYFDTGSVGSADSLSTPTRSCKRQKTIDEDDDTLYKLHRCRNERSYELNRGLYFEHEVHYEDKQFDYEDKQFDYEDKQFDYEDKQFDYEEDKQFDYDEKYPEEERNFQQVRSCETRQFVESLNDKPQYKCQQNRGQKRKASEANSEGFDIFRYRGERRAVLRTCSDLSTDISTQDVSAGLPMDVDE